ncbi:MAG: DUF4147 domain-containing protein [Bacteroidota bacterium]
MTPDAETRLAGDAQRIFSAAVRAVQAPALLDSVDLGALAGRALETFDCLVVVGAGKASIPFAGALEERLGPLATRAEGAVVVPSGYPASLPPGVPSPRRIAVREAGHPVPTDEGAVAALEALTLAGGASSKDLLIALLSGGGSALWTSPPSGLPLADVQVTTQMLLLSGQSIGAINTVRKHVSRISGGQLAAAAAPARLVALVLSDVVGDDLATIASGPTVPDPTTFADALAVVEDLDVPLAVREHLQMGSRGESPETPTTLPDEPTTVLLGSNRTALVAARGEAERLGYAVAEVREGVMGEAREVGVALARAAREAPDQPLIHLWGGETTVTVTSSGRGGRNQEVALAASLHLDGSPEAIVVLAGGTDGVDGPTDATGGCVSPLTAGRIRAAGLSPEALLSENDAYRALGAADALLRTGPTHTNVADISIAVRGD